MLTLTLTHPPSSHLPRNLPTILRHVTNQFSEPSFPSAPLPSAAASRHQLR